MKLGILVTLSIACAVGCSAAPPEDAAAGEGSASALSVGPGIYWIPERAGGTGGSATRNFPTCDDGDNVGGIYGTAGMYVNSIGIRCAYYNDKYGVVSGSQGAPNSFALDCPPQYVPVGLEVYAHTYVDRVALICSSGYHEYGATTFTVTADGTGGRGGDLHRLECPTNYVLSTLRGRAGAWLDSLEVGCSPSSR